MLEIYLKKIKEECNNLLQLINSDIFLSGTYKINKDQILIKDIEIASICMTDQDVDYKVDKSYECWGTIIELNSNNYQALEKYFNDDEVNIFREKKEKADKIIMQQLNNKFIKISLIDNRMQDAIINDICLFLFEKIFSNISQISKLMLEIYQNGGIPCGWKGIYPKGFILIHNYIRTKAIIIDEEAQSKKIEKENKLLFKYENQLKQAEEYVTDIINNKSFIRGNYIIINNQTLIDKNYIKKMKKTASLQSDDFINKTYYQLRYAITCNNNIDKSLNKLKEEFKIQNKKLSYFLNSIEKIHSNIEILIKEKCKSKNLNNKLVQNNIAHDFYNILFEVSSKSLSKISQELIEIYKNGGIPCGFDGDYPNGFMLIYNHKNI